MEPCLDRTLNQNELAVGVSIAEAHRSATIDRSRLTRLAWLAVHRWLGQLLLVAWLGTLAACSSELLNPLTPEQRAAEERARAGEALYLEKCRTVAGEKIYRKVEDVEGIVLLKLRPKAWEPQWSDRMWPGAAFALEAQGDEYIQTFLGYEEAFGPDGKPRPITQANRGYINTMAKPGPKERPGYRYVDVVDKRDGKRLRYTGSTKVVGRKDTTALGVQIELAKDPAYDLNVYRWTLDKVPAPDPSPRYGVTFEDHVIPSDRALGIASSTVKVIDLQTQEVLGEMTRYAWSMGRWVTAYKCPSHGTGASSATRKFVDQVLIPKKEETK